MSASSDDRDPVERLAEEFAERRRRGERPTIDEYAARHPELADDIRELFPALVAMEGLKAEPGRTGPLGPGHPPEGPPRRAWATSASCARSAGAAWGSSTRRSSSRSTAPSR